MIRYSSHTATTTDRRPKSKPVTEYSTRTGIAKSSWSSARITFYVYITSRSIVDQKQGATGAEAMKV